MLVDSQELKKLSVLSFKFLVILFALERPGKILN